MNYNIYPKPKKLCCKPGEYTVSQDINVVFPKEADSACRKRMGEIVASVGKTMTVSAQCVDNSTNIVLRLCGAEDAAKQERCGDEQETAGFFEKIGAYRLVSDCGNIQITGRDNDALFYGITTLKHIFRQTGGAVLRNFVLEDYADTAVRGFIEGYYGIPWSDENRISLMQFAGDFKMTSYIFAPKDDPYHSERWRDPYPAEKLAEIAKLAEAGNAVKCRFAWTIHPFMKGGITEETFDEDIQKIKNKFEQLYGAGVRQFGVLGDDSGNLPRSVVIRVMNTLQSWADEKEGVKELLFCPGGYNDRWQKDYSELNEYDAGFHRDIQIFWTGQDVCRPVEQITLENFRRKNPADGKTQRRSPLFWLNWPVNDINMSRLMMGKGSMLHSDVVPDDLAGIVTNPMQDAQASKAAVFAVADYTWNIAAFDADKSWEDSFAYIDSDAPEALYTLAKHMSDPSPNGHGLCLEESEELAPKLDAFLASCKAETVTAEQAELLGEEFRKIRKACADFHALSRNEELKKELRPFTDALSDLAEAAVLFLKAEEKQRSKETEGARAAYREAVRKLEAGQNHERIKIDGTEKALPGSKRIVPFIEQLKERLQSELSECEV